MYLLRGEKETILKCVCKVKMQQIWQDVQSRSADATRLISTLQSVYDVHALCRQIWAIYGWAVPTREKLGILQQAAQ